MTKITVSGKSLSDFLEDEADGTTIETLMIEVEEGGEFIAQVTLQEAFGCCGKVYIHDFSGPSRLMKPLIEASIKVSQKAGYSSIGLVHLTSDNVIKTAKKLKFKVAYKFKNKRSKNNLSEMYKII